MQRRWDARSWARARPYRSWRRSIGASCSSDVTPASAATFSAVSIIAHPANGSRAKLSSTQASCAPTPPISPSTQGALWKTLRCGTVVPSTPKSITSQGTPRAASSAPATYAAKRRA